MRAPCPDRQRPLTGRLLYFGGFLAPAFIAFAASARFSAHRFFVAAMILAIPSLLKRRFGFGALAGADGSDSPRILAHLAFCAIAIFRLEAALNLLRFLVGASGAVAAAAEAPTRKRKRFSAA